MITAWELRMNLHVAFSYGLLHSDIPVLNDYKKYRFMISIRDVYCISRLADNNS